MSGFVADIEVNGLEVLDSRSDGTFAHRAMTELDATRQMEGLARLGRVFMEQPETILQELVTTAVELCGAESAGISIESESRTDEDFYHWVATAGTYSGFLGARLPRYPSACGVCLERGHAQRFRVTEKFFSILGVEAPPVTDGILLPWVAGATRGTIFVMVHSREDAFVANDARVMEMLADFAAMAVRHQTQQKILIEQAGLAAEAAMARELAHRINNPLQSLTTAVYLANEGVLGADQKKLAKGMAKDVDTMAALVKGIMKQPPTTIRH